MQKAVSGGDELRISRSDTASLVKDSFTADSEALRILEKLYELSVNRSFRVSEGASAASEGGLPTRTAGKTDRRSGVKAFQQNRKASRNRMMQ